MKHIDPKALAAALAPVIAARLTEATREVEEAAARERAMLLGSEARIMKACRDLGAAVDRLDQAKFTGLKEAGARMAIERYARTVRTLIRKREEARHGR